jgi:uncharacterized protein YqjF (DUF2071 family)
MVPSPLRGASLDPDLSLVAPDRVRNPVMIQGWHRLSFVHWPIEPAVIQRSLPNALEVDTFEGAAWLGLIPFHLSVRFRGMPSIPWASRCPETNLRTYVRGPDGRRGIWFYSLEAGRLVMVLSARAWYHLPYKWSRMRMDREGSTITYESTRRWPSTGTAVRLVLEPGEAIDPAAITPLERFLVCRWRLYSPTPEGIATTTVDHPPWPLRRALIRELEQDLAPAAGLPQPDGTPLAHHSPGVVARFARRVPVPAA